MGEAIEPYDEDRMFGLYGFGGCPPGEKEVSFCFPLTGKADAPNVNGVNGMKRYYKKTIRHIRLAGPTNMSPLLGQFRISVQSQ